MIFQNKKTAQRPLNSLLNINKLEKFLKLRMPNWESIFERKIKSIIRRYTKYFIYFLFIASFKSLLISKLE